MNAPWVIRHVLTAEDRDQLSSIDGLKGSLEAIDRHCEDLIAAGGDVRPEMRQAATRAMIAIMEFLKGNQIESSAARGLRDALLAIEQTGQTPAMLQGSKTPGRPRESLERETVKGIAAAIMEHRQRACGETRCEAARWVSSHMSRGVKKALRSPEAKRISDWLSRFAVEARSESGGTGRASYVNLKAFLERRGMTDAEMIEALGAHETLIAKPSD